MFGTFSVALEWPLKAALAQLALQSQAGSSSQSAPEQEQQLQQSKNQLYQAEAQQQQVKQQLQQRQQQQQSTPSSVTFDSGSPSTSSSSPRSMRPNQKRQARSPESPQAQSPQQEQQHQQSSQKQPEQKHDNPNAMKVVLVGSECAPWSKTGMRECLKGMLCQCCAVEGVPPVIPAHHQRLLRSQEKYAVNNVLLHSSAKPLVAMAAVAQFDGTSYLPACVVCLYQSSS